ncbi:MAG TPA: hypothetical protein VLW06_12660 [Terriglobales bacterium]|nr:hypothetical protein [Terriglobales bacterium]
MSADLQNGSAERTAPNLNSVAVCSDAFFDQPQLQDGVCVQNICDALPEYKPSQSADLGGDPELWLYRERTLALLKRYLRISIEVGRLPSILGRELFRSKVTTYRMASFEDAVIFVHDVERILEQLDTFSKDLIAVIIFQDYSQDEAADILRCGRRTVCRQFPETVDQISELFLQGGLLNRLPLRPPVENSCQEGESAQFPASACKQAE